MKIMERGDQGFLVEMEGGGKTYKGEGVVYRGRKHCFPLIMYGFCSNNVLSSASLSFALFIFF